MRKSRAMRQFPLNESSHSPPTILSGYTEMMSEPLAYLQGQFVPRSQARLHVFDLGVVGGIAVAEMLRTFLHKPFRVAEHLARFEQSLKLSGLVFPVPMEELPRIIERVLASEPREVLEYDYGIIVFVTAGLNPTYVGPKEAQAAGGTLCVHTFELQWETWWHKYERGVFLATPPQHALPCEVIDPRIKVRSRMHWHLAERAAREIDSQASALLVDRDGFITETSSANFCAVIDGVIVSPPEGSVLEGVSLGMGRDLAAQLRIPFARRPITVKEALTASECFLTSTPWSILPVVKLNRHLIGDGFPGPIYRHLLRAWSEAVGTNVCLQGGVE